MMKRTGLSALSLLFSVSLASASDFSLNRAGAADLAAGEMPAPSAPAAQEKAAQKEWTIMVFSNGKNNLEKYLLDDFNEMEAVGSTDKVNVVVQLGRIDGYDSSDGDWTGVRRYFVTKDADRSKISSTLVQDLGASDMGDFKTLAAFGSWAKANYPARKYMLIIENHGDGWSRGRRVRVNRGISFDDETGNHISTPQLGAALREMGGVDVFGTDACLMQMAEVVYEIKDSARYVVGSEETEPGDGYTYDMLLGPLAANPGMAPAELGTLAVNAYGDHYDSTGDGYTQSVVDSAAVPGMLAAVNDFAAALQRSGEKELAKSARDQAVAFSTPENKDLHHFVSLVVAGTKNAEVKAKGQALLDFITSSLVLKHRSQSSSGGGWSEPVDFAPTRGLAVYMPYGLPSSGYAELQWAKASGWDEFLAWLK